MGISSSKKEESPAEEPLLAQVLERGHSSFRIFGSNTYEVQSSAEVEQSTRPPPPRVLIFPR